jgi:hypothetical protein
MAEPFSSNKVTIVRRNRVFLGCPILLVLCGLVSAAFIGILALLPLAPAVVITLLVLTGNPMPTEEDAEVMVDAEGVRVNGALEVPRDRIREAFVVPDSDSPPGARVRIERRMALPLEIRVRNKNQGRAILRALGLDATQRAMTFTLPSRASSDLSWSMPITIVSFALFVLVSMLDTVLGAMRPVMMGSIVALWGALVALTPTKLTVGADGILLSWLGRRRFWGYDDIASVETWQDGQSESTWRRSKWEGLLLHLRSGELVKFPVDEPSETGGLREQVLMLEARVREALEGHRRSAPAFDTARLERSGRNVGEWIRNLRAMGSVAAADHRTAPLDPERLWRIVEDARATPVARVSAAVALSASIDAQGRTRLKTMADAVASPRLRIALEAAASEDEEALREALSAVEANDDRSRA